MFGTDFDKKRVAARIKVIKLPYRLGSAKN
jgi:hypothetical protein